MRLADLGLEIGDWIVHTQHGVGQIRELETKTIQGKEQAYIRVEGSRYEWWLALERISDAPVRPLRKAGTFKRALRLLRQAPMELPGNQRERRAVVRGILGSRSPAALCRVVRDLTALNSERRLLDEDNRILNSCREALLQEWQLTLAVSEDAAANHLEDYLLEGRLKACEALEDK